MNFSALFIRRPVATTLVMASILLAGITGYRHLAVNDLPNVDFPTLTVSASLPGASPETMASSVATPLERQFSTIAGLDSMNSVSAVGSTQITLQFALDRDIDAAAQDVQSAISQATRRLPRDMPAPPSFRKVNPADQPILYIALSSSVLPLYKVDEYAQTSLAQRISMVSGVAQVQVFGSQKYAVRVQIDPRELAARGIGIDEVSEAIQAANVNMPLGDLQGINRTYTIESNGQLTEAAEYGPLIVAWRGGAPVRVSDVGRAIDGTENDLVAAWYNGLRGIVLAVQRQPGTNTIEVVDGIKKLLPSFRAQLPQSVEMNILFDRTESIRDSVNEVKQTLLLAVALVVFVIFLFLRTVSATIIPGLALVLSIIGTFAAMYAMNFSINNLSLMAITLSVGFVVDDAIVMLENIVRHRESGEGGIDAALRGSREIGFTIVSMTVSLVAVFIPILFMGGLVGRLLREFALSIVVAILISGFISLTLTPMLCSRFLPAEHTRRHGPLYNGLEAAFSAMLAFYRVTLRTVLRHRLLTVSSLIPLLALSGYYFTALPKGFLPSEDMGQVMAMTETAQGTSFANMVRHQQAAANIVAQDPNVDAFMSSVGSGGSSQGTNAGRLFIRLKPRDKRKPIDAVIQALRPKLAEIPGLRVFLQNRPSINVGGQMTKSLYQFTLQGTDTKTLYDTAAQFERELRDVPGFIDVTSDLQITNPQADLQIDRDRAATLGLSVRQVEDALYLAYGSRQVSTIFAPENQYFVILELQPEWQLDPTALSLLYVRSNTGALVPLDTVGKIEKSVGPLTVSHLGQLPSVTISFNLKPGVSLGEAVDKVKALASVHIPASISTSFQGTAQAFQSSMSGLNILIVAAIVVIYIVLGILYESFIHPLTILSGLPAASMGALLTLYLFGMELDIFSLVGIIMLIGIVKKNAIMMVDFAIEAQRRGSPPHEAIYEACLIRFRPIMMTTMAALMGTLPVAIGMGAGSETRRPLGLAVVGGLIVSQTLTLYITPVFYLYMESLQGFLRKLRRRRATEA